MSNIIHPTAIIGPGVELGSGNEIGPYTTIYGPTHIGDNNIIAPHVVIGTPGQDTRNPRYDSSQCLIRIGNDNIIREFTGIQKPCYRDVTEIHNRVYLMQGVHVPHDAVIHDDVVITPHVALGGISILLPGVNIALGCTVHQYSVLGHYAIAGMGAAVMKNIPPFGKHVPGKPLGVNHYAIDKFGFEAEREEIEGYLLRGERPTSARLLAITEEFERLSQASKRDIYR
jgi:UDP-N-acetylglucosamine acyltransferase